LLACCKRRRDDRLADRAQLGRNLVCQILVFLERKLDQLGSLCGRATDHYPESEVDFKRDNHGAPPLCAVPRSFGYFLQNTLTNGEFQPKFWTV